MTTRNLITRLLLYGCLNPAFWVLAVIAAVEVWQASAWRKELNRRREVLSEYSFLRKATR